MNDQNTSSLTAQDIEIIQITDNNISDEDPSISGNKIVWEQERNIVLHNLEDGTTRRITDNGEDFNPSISGNKIVWEQGDNIIVLHNLEDGTTRQITDNGEDFDPSISGNKIVWARSFYEQDEEIFLYNIDTDITRQITNDNLSDEDPYISGNKIVWEQEKNIVLHNLEDGTTRKITNSSQNYSPSISGNNIVWEQGDNIFLHNLNDSTTRQITDNGNDRDREPSISGNKIVWHRNGEIYLATLPYLVNTTGDEKAIDPKISPDASEEEGLQVTLRSLIEYANANDDFNEIKFAIPIEDQNDKDKDGDGIWKIDIGNSLKIENEDIVIDAEGQKIEVTGGSASGFIIDADNVTIRDLTINNFGGNGIWIRDGDSATIINNKIGTDITGEIDKGNGLLGIFIESSGNFIQDNVISGNGNSGVGMTGNNSTNNQIISNFIGTNADGTNALGNDQNGVSISNLGSNVIEGNTIGGNGQIGSENDAGIGISTATTNVVRNNWIGTNRDGSTQLGNANWGIDIQDSNFDNINNVIEDNTIGNNGRDGIRIFNSSTNRIENNKIGTDDTAFIDIGNKGHGILIEQGNNNQIGSRFTDEINFIWSNQESGVAIDSGIGNSINGTIFFENSKLPIDLGKDLVINNDDSGDIDTGANNLQNSPSAILLSDETGYKINLNSTPNTNFYLEFFDAKGGQLIDDAQVTTDAQGNAYYNFLRAEEIVEGLYLTATNISSVNNDTSEFSSEQTLEWDTGVNSLLSNEGDDGRIIIVGEGEIRDFGLVRSGEFLSNEVSIDIQLVNQSELQAIASALFSKAVTIFGANSKFLEILAANFVGALEEIGLPLKSLDSPLKTISKIIPIAGNVLSGLDALQGAISQSIATDNDKASINPIVFEPTQEISSTQLLFSAEIQGGEIVNVDNTPQGDRILFLKMGKDNDKLNIESDPLLIESLFPSVKDTSLVVIRDNNQTNVVNFTEEDRKSIGLVTLGGLLGGAIIGKIPGAIAGAASAGAIELLFQIAKDVIQRTIVEVAIETYGGNGNFEPITSLDVFDIIQGFDEPQNIIPLPFDIANTVKGNLLQLNGKVISNFTSDDVIQVENVNFTEDNVTITFGSAILDIDVDSDGVIDSTINLEGDFSNAEFVVEPVSFEDFSSTFISIEETEEATDSEINISDVSLAERDEDNTEFIFTVSLNKASTETITVDYATADDTAIAGEDYVNTSGILEFAPEETEKTITVEVIGDTNIEEDETFLVNLSNASGADISDSQGIGTINNDDVDSQINLAIDNITVDEDANNTQINLSDALANNDNEVVFNILANNNESLVIADLEGSNLTLDYQDNEFGTAEITVRAIYGEEIIEDSFTVTVNPIDDAPIVGNQISDINVNENSDSSVIDLSDTFTDIDNDDAGIVKTVSVNSNEDLVTASIDNNNLTLDYQENQFGTAEITIQGESNGKTITDSFTVAVQETIYSGEYLVGSELADDLTGGKGNDSIFGGKGNDTISGGEGDDFLIGLNDHDLIEGNQGNDHLVGYEGDDTILGGLGDDILRGSQGDDSLEGNEGHDLLSGGTGKDILMGSIGEDTLYGGEDEDTLVGGSDEDIFYIQSDRGLDIIADFEIGLDTFDLRDNLTFEDLVLTNSDGTNTTIKNHDDLALAEVKNLTPELFTAEMFVEF